MTNSLLDKPSNQVVKEGNLFNPEIQAEIKRLSRQPYIEYPQVQRAHAWLFELTISRTTGLITGESRSGKTVACKSFVKKYNSQVAGKGRRIKPAVYIQIPPGCGSQEFFIKILKQLNKPTNGSTCDLRERTLGGLIDHKSEILVIDEANHLKQETFGDVRHIYDDEDLNMAVVLTGTVHRLHAVLDRDEQVANRFMEEFQMDRLEDREFKQLVQIWERDILRLPEPSNLGSETDLKLIQDASRNLIGRMDMLLRKAAIRALSRGEKKITPQILNQVLSSTEWSKEKKRK